ncbi:MAG: VCBS repeat-containing protein [Candidatus Stahlbacteria bacterium]|nr:VCBS repeat-containing protein [Candidatus Stahlbacteria bacterium]
MRYLSVILSIIGGTNLHSGVWVEKSHTDFADGQEYYYVNGDTATLWNNLKLRKWNLGSVIYSPVNGGLRIIGKDWDLDNNGWLDVVLTWEDGNKVDIYWNNATGFNLSNKIELSGLYNEPQGVSAGDIDADGYEDIVIAGYSGGGGIHIFHGSSSGYSSMPDDYINSLGDCQHPCLGDINNDGYIDLIIGTSSNIYIYYGPGPFQSASPAFSISLSGIAHRLTVADINYDNKLDIISSSDGGNVYIFYGPNFVSRSTLTTGGNWDHSIADINKDGYLDTYINDGSAIIYWGSLSGFNTSTSIAGDGIGDCSIEDINGDGELDIAANHTGITAGYVIWGPNYTSYVSLPSGGALSVVVNIADFDNDGDKDVIFGGRYAGPTYLYWNNSGFSSANRFTFPNPCNDALFEDLGNLWDRSNKERYLSSVFNANDTIKVDSVRWWGDFLGVDIEVWMRGAKDTSSWNPWVRLYNGGTDSTLSQVQYLQYKCGFSLDYKLTSLFSFDSIKVYFDTLPIGVEIEPKVYGLDIYNYNNPFRENTIFTFSLPEDGRVNLTIYNLAGEKVKELIVNKQYLTGMYTNLWDATSDYGIRVSSGVYFYAFEFIGSKKLHRITKNFVVF